jgi:hypothetical protein
VGPTKPRFRSLAAGGRAGDLPHLEEDGVAAGAAHFDRGAGEVVGEEVGRRRAARGVFDGVQPPVEGAEGRLAAVSLTPRRPGGEPRVVAQVGPGVAVARPSPRRTDSITTPSASASTTVHRSRLVTPATAVSMVTEKPGPHSARISSAV